MFGTGATDINDLITNTAGAYLGFIIYRLLYKAIPRPWIKHIQVDGAQCYYELLLFWSGALLIMLTVQLSIFHALFATRMTGSDIQEWKQVNFGSFICFFREARKLKKKLLEQGDN